MNEREIAEIRRRMRPEKNNIGRIRGCYVNENKSIISEFDQNLGLISNEEAEGIISLFRKTYSGALVRNLLDISFTNLQVSEGEEHKLLSALRSSSLSDDEAVKAFFEKTVASLDIEGRYLILLGNDKYDIPKFGKDGEIEDSFEMFSYIICAICPIKASKSALGYNISEKKFKNFVTDSIITAPEIGFMYPSYESKSANIYGALYYTRDISSSHQEFTNALFKTDLPRPAAEQTAGIAEILNSTVAEECDLELIQLVQGQLIELKTDHKNNKEEEPLKLSSKDMGSLLRCGGINEEAVSAFSQKFESDFGENTAIPPENIIDIKKFEVKTPEVTIKVSPECSEKIETRVIDGTKYLLIRADGDVEVNGIKINIKEQ